MRRVRFCLMLCALALAVVPASAQSRITVVASFSILGDFARQIGGDRISLATLVGPNGDAHVYTPSPADAKKVADAKLLIVNGLGFEGWLPRLVQSSGGKTATVTATDGIARRKRGGEADPHAWQSVTNAKIYVANIRDALIAADRDGAAIYRARAESYLAKLDALDDEVRQMVAAIPAARRKVISTHDAFGYFADAYDIAFIGLLGVSTNSEPSAGDIAGIIKRIRADNIPAVFLENISDSRLIRRIGKETGATIGGALYSDSLTAENGDAPTYIDMVRYNIRALTRALAP